MTYLRYCAHAENFTEITVKDETGPFCTPQYGTKDANKTFFLHLVGSLGVIFTTENLRKRNITHFSWCYMVVERCDPLTVSLSVSTTIGGRMEPVWY
ncbi:hypothetical protein KY290_031666 [Solanum tuberosum]|uniref:Uncharacterized protein n=1 Tax=Solanum tuberosum TaxID=4113 RepID=A0ABQ7UBN2_SOLTU|nr:hypothetical protein KY284_030728 [Solanum tuberosum]KAH0653378.1 hypothetical protein KY289_031056 [Solanum tuberosum]KAH0743673.1 hypothetical protein KY290_031666 [Solanum tuberosum]